MKVKAMKKEGKSGGLMLAVLKGAVIALCISMICVLIFAFLLKFTNISDKIITPINQVIKGVSVFLGVFFGFRKQKKMGLVGGLLVGLLYTTLAFLTFSLLGGSFVFDRTLIYDIIFGTIIGGICGVISVNLKKNSI